MWTKGEILIPSENGENTPIRYWAKVYAQNSQFGIEGGKISKLMLKQNDEIVYNYDRGLDIPPQTPEADTALAILLYHFK